MIEISTTNAKITETDILIEATIHFQRSRLIVNFTCFQGAKEECDRYVIRRYTRYYAIWDLIIDLG